MLAFEDTLNAMHIPFELFRHEIHIRTAKEGAAYFRIEIGQTAPTLILHTDLGFYALVVSGDRGKVDFERIKEIVNCQTVRLATKDEVKQVTGFDVGAVSMLGLPIPYLIDKRLFNYAEIYGGTGEPDSTLKVTPEALIRLGQVAGTLE